VALSNKNPQAGKHLLTQGLQLRYAINDKLGISTSLLHLAQWHLEHDPPRAQSYAERSVSLSKEMKAVDVETEALEILVAVKNNPKKEAIQWVYLIDSINAATKKSFHQAIGLRFRTNEMEQENLLLEREKETQKLLAKKERAQKWAIGSGLAVSLAVLGIFFIIFRKNQKQKKEIEKQKDLVEKLQRELHHRLKNNLSFIDFFITLAKGKFPDPAYRSKLDELQNRINSMFEVHRQLFKKEDVTSVNAKTYISALVENVKKAYAVPNITLEENVADTDLRADTSFPIGLIVNEFVTNSYKYAFPNNENGIISINLKEENNQYHLQLADNGKGLPKDFDIDSLDSFGMETIKLLTQEYKGTFTLNGTNGTRMDITFPKNAA
jgi:two-component sensor histidine kinase